MPYQDYYCDKVILVTGGAGAIGRNLVEKLSELGAGKVVVLDNLSSAYLWNVPDRKNVLFVKGDIRNDDDLRRVFRHKPVIVFHLAAFFANQNSVDYPITAADVNITGLLKVLEYCAVAGNIERLVYTNSEGGAYGDHSQLPYREKDISYRLYSPYYISKMAGESYCYFYHSYHGIPVSVLRLFNSYGPGEVPGQYRNVIPNFFYWALNKQALPLTGNREIARDFVFVRQTVEGILRAGYFKQAVGQSVNITTSQEYSIYRIAERINKMTSNPAGVRIIEQRKWDTRTRVTGNNEKCREILKFDPVYDLESGLELTLQWFRDRREDIMRSAEFNPGMNPALQKD